MKSQMLVVFAAAAAALAAGCVVIDVDRDPGPALRGADLASCRADRYLDLIGKDGDRLDAALLPASHRIIPHGGMVTMDHNPQRLNIELDEDGDVARLSCG